MRFYSLWLALICIMTFILQLLIPGFTDLLVLNQHSFPQLWRFLTAIFLHGGLGHLTLNLFGLVFFGLALEKLTSSKKFLIIFFLSGIVANLISVFFYPSSLGASGAIFGLIGALTIIRPMMPVWAFGLILPLFLAAIVWVTGDILMALYASDSVGHLAHLSGIAIGFVFGALFRSNKEDKRSRSSSAKIPESKIRQWEEKHLSHHL